MPGVLRLLALGMFRVHSAIARKNLGLSTGVFLMCWTSVLFYLFGANPMTFGEGLAHQRADPLKNRVGLEQSGFGTIENQHVENCTVLTR